MIGRATAAGLVCALLVGCTQPAQTQRQTQTQSLPPPPPQPLAVADPCEQLADEAIREINAYLAEAGPSIENAPRMPRGNPGLERREIRAAGCKDDEFFDLLAERAPQVQGDDELARYVQALLVALAHPEDGETLAWILAFGPPSWVRQPRGHLSSRKVKVDSATWSSPHEKRIERAMRKPPKLRIPDPVYSPPLPPPDWQD